MKTSARLLMLAALAAFTAAPAAAQTPGAAPSGESRVSGQSVFKTYCASCHGESGRGNGAVAIFLRRRPADLTQIAIRNKGTFPADRVSADDRRPAGREGARRLADARLGGRLREVRH